MKKLIIISTVFLMILSGCSASESSTNATEKVTTAESAEVQTETKGEEDNMKVTVNNTEYNVKLDSNITVNDIVSKLPLDLMLVRYAGHEYYSELPFTPNFADDTTSDIKAGHIYYWDGWNAFVLNFEDCNIAPYKVVHIGEIESDNIADILRNSDEKIKVSVK